MSDGDVTLSPDQQALHDAWTDWVREHLGSGDPGRVERAAAAGREAIAAGRGINDAYAAARAAWAPNRQIRADSLPPAAPLIGLSLGIAAIAVLWQVPGWAPAEEVAYPTSHPATTGMMAALALSTAAILIGSWANRRPMIVLIGYPVIGAAAIGVSVINMLVGLLVGLGLSGFAVAVVVVEIVFLVGEPRDRWTLLATASVFVGAVGWFLWLPLGPGTFLNDMFKSGNLL